MTYEFIKAKKVEISFDDFGCQVIFHEESVDPNDRKYILFQFCEEEFEDTPKGNYIYIESDRAHLVGFYKKGVNAILTRRMLLVKISQNVDIQVMFKVSESKYKELILRFETMFFGIGVFKYER